MIEMITQIAISLFIIAAIALAKYKFNVSYTNSIVLFVCSFSMQLMIFNTHRINDSIRSINSINHEVKLKSTSEQKIVQIYEEILNNQDRTFNWMIMQIGVLVTVLITGSIFYNLTIAKSQIKTEAIESINSEMLQARLELAKDIKIAVEDSKIELAKDIDTAVKNSKTELAKDIETAVKYSKIEFKREIEDSMLANKHSLDYNTSMLFSNTFYITKDYFLSFKHSLNVLRLSIDSNNTNNILKSIKISIERIDSVINNKTIIKSDDYKYKKIEEIVIKTLSIEKCSTEGKNLYMKLIELKEYLKTMKSK